MYQTRSNYIILPRIWEKIEMLCDSSDFFFFLISNFNDVAYKKVFQNNMHNIFHQLTLLVFNTVTTHTLDTLPIDYLKFCIVLCKNSDIYNVCALI